MKTCDSASVGVLAERTGPQGRARWLFIWRSTFPNGVAPVSGHVSGEHEHYADAARAALKEEAGLEVAEVHWTPVGGWRPDRCRHRPGAAGTGHQWEVYVAYLDGPEPELKVPEREVRMARWLSAPQVQLLANRTLLYAQGRVAEGDWCNFPGIEPVWTGFLAELDVIRMRERDLELIAHHMAERRPLAS